jgi:hypothetical protein
MRSCDDNGILAGATCTLFDVVLRQEVTMLDQLLFVSRTIDPVATPDIDGLERELGALPHGYRAAMARLGRCAGTVRLGFCGELVVLAPDQLRRQRADLTGYFAAPDWPNKEELFSPDECARLISFAHDDNCDELVFLPGRDQLYCFPNPRSSDPEIALVGEDVDAALTWYAQKRNFRVAYFQSGIGQTTTKLARPDLDEAWRRLDGLAADAVDEEQWSMFFVAHEARVWLPDWAEYAIVEHPEDATQLVERVRARLAS